MGYPIPPEALDDRLAWTGTSGSGKTYNAGVGVEKLLAAGARAVVVDPLDVWWGLRLTEDGKRASRFKPVIFGGARGDLPLTERGGLLLGETVAKMRESCIVSLGDFKSTAAERRFMLDFLSALYRNATGEPVHLVFDEADLWAPQLILDRDGDAAKLLGQMQTIVRRGRIKGFIPWLITQRPAEISKGILSQADGLLAFKLMSSQDRDAIGGWIKGQADAEAGKAMLASLPSLQQAQGVVWIPGRGILETAQFPAKSTFDSSRTPKRGEKVIAGALTPLDLGALKQRLAAVEEEVRANDPKALKAEIARLKAEAAKAPAADPKAVEVAAAAAYSRGKVDGYAEGITAARAAVAPVLAALPGLDKALGDLRAAVKTMDGWEGRVPKGPPPVTSTVAAIPKAPRPSLASAPAAPSPPGRGPMGESTITGPQQRILNALAWWAAFGLAQPTNEQVGFVAGYAPGSGNFNNLRGGLRAAGLIDYPSGGRVALTAEGLASAQAADLDLSRDAFHAAVRAKLNGPQVRLLDPVLAAYPEALTTNELAEAAGYAAGIEWKKMGAPEC